MLDALLKKRTRRNVAGPRESKAIGIQERTRLFLAEVLQGMLENAFV